jgi:hypothetical protein
VFGSLLALTSTSKVTAKILLRERTSPGISPSLAGSDRQWEWEGYEARALALTPTPLPVPWEAMEENGAPLRAPLQLVLSAGGEPKLTGRHAALRQPHPLQKMRYCCLGRFALRRRALRRGDRVISVVVGLRMG